VNEIATANPRERRALFSTTASRLGMTPLVAEKDFWVVWTLSRLFPRIEHPPRMIFKGGTSLSKAYNAIQRFSEDIDLSIDPEVFGASPSGVLNATSNAARARENDALRQRGREYIQDLLLPRLVADFETVLGPAASVWSLEADPDSTDALVFRYPSETEANSYNPQRVLLEFGVRSELWPYEIRPVRAFAADVVTRTSGVRDVDVPVLAGERTFWEKATLLHAVHHWKATKSIGRLSRHYGDLVQLAHGPIGEAALARPDLLDAVREHKKRFYPDNNAKYDLAVRGTLRLAPHGELQTRLEKDWRDMREMFFGDADPEPFAVIADRLRELEQRINRNDHPT
jgi:hypothetical protein